MYKYKYLLVFLFIAIGIWGAYNYFSKAVLTTSSEISSVVFSPNNKTLAVANDRQVMLWSLETREILESFAVKRSRLRSVTFTPDGNYLAILTAFGGAKFRSVEHPQKEKTFDTHCQDLRTLSFSPDGKLVAFAGFGFHGKHANGVVEIFSIQTGRNIQNLYRYHFAIFGPKGKWLAAVTDPLSAEGCCVELLAIKNKTDIEIEEVEHKRTMAKDIEYVACLAFSPNGKILAGTDKHRIKLWDIETGEIINTLARPYYGDVTSILFSPNGKLIASTQGSKVRLWEVSTGKEIETHWEHSRQVTSISFSPDGKFLASGGADCKVMLWEIISVKK